MNESIDMGMAEEVPSTNSTKEEFHISRLGIFTDWIDPGSDFTSIDYDELTLLESFSSNDMAIS